MKPRKIRRLRKRILSPGYYSFRWAWTIKESNLWWQDWLITRQNDAIKYSTRYDKKATWYSKRIDK